MGTGLVGGICADFASRSVQSVPSLCSSMEKSLAWLGLWSARRSGSWSRGGKMSYSFDSATLGDKEEERASTRFRYE